jgi:hypothetical protein
MTTLQTIVTHLAMDAPLAVAGGDIAWPEGVSFEREQSMALNDYRALYDLVGRKWHWVNRRHLDDRQLAALISASRDCFSRFNRRRDWQWPRPVGDEKLHANHQGA